MTTESENKKDIKEIASDAAKAVQKEIDDATARIMQAQSVDELGMALFNGVVAFQLNGDTKPLQKAMLAAGREYYRRPISRETGRTLGEYLGAVDAIQHLFYKQQREIEYTNTTTELITMASEFSFASEQIEYTQYELLPTLQEKYAAENMFLQMLEYRDTLKISMRNYIAARLTIEEIAKQFNIPHPYSYGRISACENGELKYNIKAQRYNAFTERYSEIIKMRNPAAYKITYEKLPRLRDKYLLAKRKLQGARKYWIISTKKRETREQTFMASMRLWHNVQAALDIFSI